jgi:hypothetical protein
MKTSLGRQELVLVRGVNDVGYMRGHGDGVKTGKKKGKPSN